VGEADTSHIDFPAVLKGRPVQKQIYAALQQAEGEMKRAEIADVTRIDPDSVSQALRGLRSDDLVEKVGHGLYSLPSDSHTDNVSKSTPTVDTREEDGLLSLIESTAVMEIHTEAKVSAGDGRVVYPSEATREVEVPKSFLAEVIGFRPPSRIGILLAEGDSMKPTIRDGELVIWQPLEDGIQSAGVYVLKLAHGTVVKRVQPFPDGSYRIISDNDYDGYEDVTLVPSENGQELVQESTGRVAEMYPVGKVLFPDRSTDQMHVKQVSSIIQRIVSDDVDPNTLA